MVSRATQRDEPTPGRENERQGKLADGIRVLDLLAARAEVEVDPGELVRAVANADRETRGPFEEVWSRWLSVAGRGVGLRVWALRRSLREACDLIRERSPIVMAGRSGDAPGWLVLGGSRSHRVLLIGVAPGEGDRWVSLAEASRLAGLNGPNDEVEFLVAHGAAPLEGMLSDPAFKDSGERHGHEAGVQGRRSPFSRLLGLVRPEWSDIWIVVVFALVIGILLLASPLAVEALVNTVAFGGMLQPVVVVSLLLLACLGFAAILRALQTWVVEIIQRRVFVRVVADLAHRLPRVHAEAFDSQHGPELVNRFFDVLTVQKVGAALLLDALTLILGALIGLLLLAFYHPFLLGYDVILLAAIAFIVVLMGRGAVRTSIAESQAKYAVAACMEDLARNPRAFKVAGGPEFALERADEFARDYLTARQAHFRILFRQITFALALQAIAGTTLLGLGGWLVVAGQLTLGQLVAAELIVSVVVDSFAKLGKHLEGWYDLMAACEKLGHLVDMPLERTDGEDPPLEPGPASLSFTEVSFHYTPDRPVLEGLSFTIPAGSRVALVGPSGAGKSTLVDLIFGLRSPSHGHVDLDDIDLRTFRLPALREHVAVVRGIDIFEGTIAENILVGRRNLTLIDVQEALRDVELLETARMLPDGLQTRLMAGGAPLANGQAMRLALARAIVGKPRLLVIDELLDWLDVDTRDGIIDTLFASERPWSLLVVTHNPQLMARCDRKIVLPSPWGAASKALDSALG